MERTTWPSVLGALVVSYGCARMPDPARLRSAPDCHAWMRGISGGALYVSQVENGHAYRADGMREEVAYRSETGELFASGWVRSRVGTEGPGKVVTIRSVIGLTIQTISFEGGRTSRIGLETIEYSDACTDSDAALAIASTFLMFNRRE